MRGKEVGIGGNHRSILVTPPLPSFPPSFLPACLPSPFPSSVKALFPLKDRRSIPYIPPPGSSAFPILDDRAKRLKLAAGTAGTAGADGRLALTLEQEAIEHHKAVQVGVGVGVGGGSTSFSPLLRPLFPPLFYLISPFSSPPSLPPSLSPS